MKITFAGTGIATSTDHPNTSIFIETENETHGILIDCGFSAVREIWAHQIQKKTDILFITHFHADHTLGIPGFLLRLDEEKRTDPLTIIGPEGTKDYINSLMELSYPGYINKQCYELIFREVTSESKLIIENLVLSFAKATHTESSLAIRIEHNGKSVVYSGDSAYSKDIEHLAKGADLLIHEAFTDENERKEQRLINHSSFLSAAECAKNANAKSLALVHTRDEKKTDEQAILAEASSVYKGKIIIPYERETIETS